MGVVKRFKDMKQAVSAAPGLVDQAQQMQAQAQQLQAAQMAAAGAATGTQAIDPQLLEPIAGVTLERYAELAKAIGERKLDQAGIESFVKLQGVSPEDWKTAYDGWNDRFKGNMALSVRFGTLYQQARSL